MKQDVENVLMCNSIINPLNNLGLSMSLTLGGLGLFLVSIKLLSNGLKTISGDRLRGILKKFTKTNFHSLIFGMAFTTMIQSSDGAIALVISLVAAGFLPLRSALAFVLGANIGTATTSIIVSLSSNFKFTQYFMILAFIGGMAFLLIKDKAKSNIALIITSLGMLFIGLKILSLGMETISRQEIFTHIVSNVGQNAWLSAFVSFIMTGIMQSSSASVTIAQTLYQSSGSMLLIGGIGFVVGANIGTTITAFLASISSGKNTKRIAVFWMITNFLIAMIILPIASFYADFIRLMIPDKINAQGGHDNFQMAISHVFFNVILVVIFFPLISKMELLIRWIIKEDKETEIKYECHLPITLVSNSHQLSLEAANNTFSTIGEINLDSIETLAKYLETNNKKYLSRTEKLLFTIGEMRKTLYNFLLKLNLEELNIYESKRLMSLVVSTKSQGRISKLIKEFENMIVSTYNNKKKKLIISNVLMKEIKEALLFIAKLQKKSISQSKKWSKTRNNDMKSINEKIYEFVETSIENNIKRSKNNEVENSEFDFYALMHVFERISKHQYNISKYFKQKNKKNKKKHFLIIIEY